MSMRASEPTRAIALSLIILALSGCATSYQRSGFSGGFSETRLSEDLFRVSFQGNGYTSRSQVEEMALLRSAEVALERGYNYFVIIDGRSDVSHASFTTPTQSTTTGTVTGYGNTAYVNAQTRTTGGQVINIAKPSSSNLILCFREKPEGAGVPYDARIVFKSLSPRYGATASR